MDIPSLLATAPELCRALGSRLRAQRLAQGLAQDALAQRAGVSLGALKKTEKDGQANMLTLVRIVQSLGLAGELESLFALHPQASIADMEQAARAQRRRAPRRSA
jgi:transcriptional regulator with XRE-family HTH domain